MAVLECVKPGAKLGQIILALGCLIKGAIALWTLAKAIAVLPHHLHCMRMVVLLVKNEILGFLAFYQPTVMCDRTNL